MSVLECIFHEINGPGRDDEYLHYPKFTGYIILICTNVHEQQDMITKINNQSMKVGLTININKTKIMTNSPSNMKAM